MAQMEIIVYTKVWCLVSYGMVCHQGNFLDDTLMNKQRNNVSSWMMDEFIHWPKPYLRNLRWDIIINDWIMDEKSLGKW